MNRAVVPRGEPDAERGLNVNRLALIDVPDGISFVGMFPDDNLSATETKLPHRNVSRPKNLSFMFYVTSGTDTCCHFLLLGPLMITLPARCHQIVPLPFPLLVKWLYV